MVNIFAMYVQLSSLDFVGLWPVNDILRDAARVGGLQAGVGELGELDSINRRQSGGDDLPSDPPHLVETLHSHL